MTAEREALAELVAAHEAQAAQRMLARRYYMPDKALAVDARVERAWAAAVATISQPVEQPSAQPVAWQALYRRALSEANGLTNYVEDRPELRRAEKRLEAIEAEARTLAACSQPPVTTGEPQAPQPLTDEQIDMIANDGMRNAAGGVYATRVYEFARAVEAEVLRTHGISKRGD